MLAIEKAGEAWRQIDAVLLTDDAAYTPVMNSTIGSGIGTGAPSAMPVVSMIPDSAWICHSESARPARGPSVPLSARTNAELWSPAGNQQVSGQTAIKLLEQLWNRDLSDHDPDGPLPDVDPLVGEHTIARGRASVRMHRDPLATARQWRELAEAKHLSTRELIIEVTGRQSFIGTPAHVAAARVGALLQRGRSRPRGGDDRRRATGGLR